MRPADIQRSDRDAAVRDINASIARAYDLVGYEPPVNDLLHPDNLLGLAALYGCAPAGGDVLDLGCGTAAQLVRVGDRISGRLVGIDISKAAVAQARKRCARFGQRADIRCADALDVDTDELGQFDLIYHIGVLYVTPSEVRRAPLNVIRRCLKPGGVAAISYYAGTIHGAYGAQGSADTAAFSQSS